MRWDFFLSDQFGYPDGGASEPIGDVTRANNVGRGRVEVVRNSFEMIGLLVQMGKDFDELSGVRSGSFFKLIDSLAKFVALRNSRSDLSLKFA